MRPAFTLRCSFGVILVAVLAIAFTSAPTTVLAALPAPTWLPNQPILAGNQVIAMWIPVPGAVKYNLYVNGTKIAEIPANQYIGPAPEGSGKFEFKVTAVDASGTESPQSGAGFITIIKLQPPGKPLTRINQDDASVQLRWNAPTGAAVFNVYRAASKEGPWELRGSVQEESYKDAGLEVGKTVYYALTSKDMMGKESERGEIAEVTLEAKKVVKLAKSFQVKIVPTRLERRIRLLGDLPIGTLTSMKRRSNGQFYLLGTNDQIRVVNENMEIVRWINVPVPEGSGLNRPISLYNINFIDDDTLLLCDVGNGLVLVFDERRNVVTNWFRGAKPTQEQDKETYALIQDRHKGVRTVPITAVQLQDGRYLVSDEKGTILHIINEKGISEGWLAQYNAAEEGQPPNMRRLNLVGDMMPLENGDVLLMSGRQLIRMDTKTWRPRWVAGEFSGMVGNFIGYGGWSRLGENRLIVADQTMHTIQVFDLETGDYLFSFGGPENKPDPAQMTRALLDFNGPMDPFILSNGNLLLYLSMEKDFLIRKVLEPMP